MVDLSLVRSGQKFSESEHLVDIARWGHFADSTMPWEKIGLL
jgi:hypothetical protein